MRNNGNIGVYVVGPGQANLDHVRLEANNTGLAAEFGGQAAMQDSIVTGSPNIGVVVIERQRRRSQVTISRSLISSNNFGIFVEGSFADFTRQASVSVAESAISNNTVGVHATSDGTPTQGKATLKHNTVASNGIGLELVDYGTAILDSNNIFGTNVVDLAVDVFSGVYSLKNNMVGSIVGTGAIVPIAPL